MLKYNISFVINIVFSAIFQHFTEKGIPMYQVVFVDDDPLIVEGLQNVIDWSGFNFEISFKTTNPMSALKYLQKHPVDLLLTDICMPQMNGIELIKKAKELNPLLHILVLSAYDTFNFVRSAMSYGAENYLLKPLDPEELSQSVSSIANHLQENETFFNIYGSSMITFRSSFVESWVKSTLTDDEFFTKANMLDINLQLDNYTVFIISSPKKSSHAISHLFDLIISRLSAEYICHFYFETPFCFVCIISTRSAGKNVMSLLENLNALRPILGFPFFISIGNTVDCYEDVSVSYRNAYKYLFLQYSPINSFICFQNTIPFSVQRMIERDYQTIEVSSYLDDIKKTLWNIKDSNTRMLYQLSVVSWGVSQISVGQILDPSIIALLSDIVCNVENVSDVITYLEKFVKTAVCVLEQKTKKQNASFPCVDIAIQAVHDFPNKDISLKTLAAKMNMHPSYLGNIFHRQTGLYFNDYLNRERLTYATELMENTNLKLKDIVSQAGFSSQTYFNRLFKRRYGISPTAYRRNIKLNPNCKMNMQ